MPGLAREASGAVLCGSTREATRVAEPCAPAVGDHLEAIGAVLKLGRTLTVCQLEVYGVQADGARKLVANGQQTLIRMNRPAA
ncbi:hypothetical protein GCM10010515_72290 [Streptomyces fructofermentans]|uniref:Thioesterase domain-containing protein n=1 Tax=Streptomyces fructofermentans TaxID=152141 RepID=A0A918NTK0_9ACTN|nr:hypothetical protein GCM10010515_72290 [Streptomyces fructofermentans]